ncbi:MAG: cytochrome P450, partial [Steroidobacteraceae bacterium]
MSESKAAPPRGIRLTPLDPSFRNDPYSVLKSLREHDPVMRDDEFGRWFLTRFDDVSHLLRDKHTSVNPRSGNLPPTYSARMQRPDSPQSRTGVLSSIIFLDDPAHRRLRGLVSKAFTPGAVEALRPRVRAIVRELLAAIREREFELVGTFAAPLTAAVTAELLEIDPADRSAFGSWSELLVTSFYNPFLSPAKVALAASARRMLEEYLSALIARRRQHPTSDLITAMLNVHDAENRLTDDEIVQQCSLLILAGQVTTTDAIGNGVKALIEHPQELAKLRARGDLIDSAVEEMLRY